MNSLTFHSQNRQKIFKKTAWKTRWAHIVTKNLNSRHSMVPTSASTLTWCRLRIRCKSYQSHDSTWPTKRWVSSSETRCAGTQLDRQVHSSWTWCTQTSSIRHLWRARFQPWRVAFRSLLRALQTWPRIKLCPLKASKSRQGCSKCETRSRKIASLTTSTWAAW